MDDEWKREGDEKLARANRPSEGPAWRSCKAGLRELGLQIGELGGRERT